MVDEMIDVENSEQANERLLVVTTKIKEFIKSTDDILVSKDFIQALNDDVKMLIKKAVARCKANGRKTMRGSDA